MTLEPLEDSRLPAKTGGNMAETESASSWRATGRHNKMGTQRRKCYREVLQEGQWFGKCSPPVADQGKARLTELWELQLSATLRHMDLLSRAAAS